MPAATMTATACAACAEPIPATGRAGRPAKYHPECYRKTRAASARSSRAAAASRLIPWDPAWASYPVEVEPEALLEILGAGERDADGREVTPWLVGAPLVLTPTPDAAEAARDAIEDYLGDPRARYGVGLAPHERPYDALVKGWRERVAPRGREDDPAHRYAEAVSAAGLAPGEWHVEPRRLPESERRPHIPSGHVDPDPERVDTAFRLLEAEARHRGVIGAAA